MKRVLIFSLGVNLALLAVVAGRRPQTVMPSEPEVRSEIQSRSLPQSRTARSAAPSKINTPWSKIENRDVRQFVTNLRAIGCPEQTIKDIVTLRICRAYRERHIQMIAELARKHAATENPDNAEWRKISEGNQNLRDEMISELESVLGEDWGLLSSSLTGFPYSGNGLAQIISTEKRAQLREITKQFRHDLDDLHQKAMSGLVDKQEAATLRDLQRQKRDAMAAVLSPQELEEYLYRDSPAADYVRKNLPEAKSEGEYRAMVKLALELEMSSYPNSEANRFGIVADSELEQELKSRNDNFARRLKELLGDDRITEQQAQEKTRAAAETQEREERGKQEVKQQLTEAATAIGVSADSAGRFFERLQASESEMKKRFEEMEKNLTGTPAEKQKQMEAVIKAELNKTATETMGPKGPDVVERLFNKNR